MKLLAINYTHPEAFEYQLNTNSL